MIEIRLKGKVMSKKRCNKCNVIKPLELFYIDRSKKDNHRGDCAECNKRTVNEYYHNNREKESIRVMAYYYKMKYRALNGK
jgi:hypothetical protein